MSEVGIGSGSQVIIQQNTGFLGYIEQGPGKLDSTARSSLSLGLDQRSQVIQI